MSPFERTNPESNEPFTVRTMWNNGPDRRWSDSKRSGVSMPSADGGFLGQYVCQGCRMPTTGVYRVNSHEFGGTMWLCSPCAFPKKEKAA